MDIQEFAFRILYYVVRAQALPLVPDSFFWYTVATALFVFALWVGKKFIENQEEKNKEQAVLTKEISKCVVELTTITKIHDIHIKSLLDNVKKQGEDMETLREFYIVTYKK